jgi:ribonuclease E
MVELPEVVKDTVAEQEARAQRPQAAVQGITPAQPAPMRQAEPVAVAAQPSFLSRLFGWFKSSPEPEKTEAKPAATARPARASPPRREREGGRPEETRNEGGRQRNKPRRERGEETQREKPARQEGAPKPEAPRAERPPRIATEKPALEAATPEQNSEGNGRTGRKRGRRGGSRERERREQPNGGEQMANAATTGEVTPATQSAPRAEAVEQPRHNAAAYLHEAPATPVAERQAAPVETPVAAPVVAHVPVHVPEPAVVAAHAPVVVEQPTAPVAAPAPAPAPVQYTLPAESNLEQVETAPAKLAALATQRIEAAQPPVTRRRSRPREVYSMENSEPLVQIETHNSPQ